MFDTRPDREAEVVLVGRSNVGKSTLMRELTGHTKFDTGGKPGVTRKPNHYDWTAEDFVITDLPGFGFMSGVDEEVREEIKTNIVRYLETYAENVLVAILVVDGKSAVDIIDRHSGPDEIPYDVEMYYFLEDLGIPTVVAVNKMDKVDDRDERLDEICDRLGLYPPWKQWQDVIAPITAKNGRIGPLNEAVRTHLHEERRDDLFKFF
ncbi:GTP-binding protein EngB [Natrarchaeobaculum sulfurireducens]|uniref:Probable GTP-binding protein EngB n=1 Tax=Natrarchaeobaculum sulfurireducens TaxID=2044521 RepID=A0A346PLB7_9EURY|nr:GTP-binding protein EngB [Natrarchaeobaculum sulfurireducens]AXR76642.1 GTP-binding protein EngB [Natrarchaeobaculum sulfurireducens]AXR80312.1 GTP-binding protein EngB [Natrarchaeobaculum sulfurireducens]